jgi:hypothetical protein
MDISPLSLVLIALVLAAWAVGASLVVLRANRSVKRAKAARTSLKRMQTLLDVAPALPLLVRVDGRIEAPDKLARLLGLAAMPQYLSELAAPRATQKLAGSPPDSSSSYGQKSRSPRKALRRSAWR